MKLLLDEMNPPALGRVGIEPVTVADLRMSGSPDRGVFGIAQESGRALLTENVAYSTRLATDLSMSGGHHAGLLIALSSRFSRRPAGLPAIAQAVQAIAEQDPADRVIYLR